MKIDVMQVLSIGFIVSAMAHWDKACAVLGICFIASLAVKGLR